MAMVRIGEVFDFLQWYIERDTREIDAVYYILGYIGERLAEMKLNRAVAFIYIIN